MPTDLPELIATVRQLMAPYTGTWALCGGWAVDAWLGRVTREHEDIDVAVFRDEQELIHRELGPTWQLVAHETKEAAHDVPWDGHPLARWSHVHAGEAVEPERELHVSERGEGVWLLGHWSLGDRTAALPQGRFALETGWGVPLMAPEAIAFYKSIGERRRRDELDLVNLMESTLTDDQRAWLRDAVRLTSEDSTGSS